MFQPDLTEDEQDRVLANIARWNGVRNAARLNPSVTIEPVRRMFYIVTRPDTDSGPITDMVMALPEVQSAALPAVRAAADVDVEPRSAPRGPSSLVVNHGDDD